MSVSEVITGVTMLLRLLKASVSIHKYPRYLVDGYVNLIWQAWHRRQGIELGRGIVWLGKPIISLAKGSSLRIGEGCLICSRASQTALGVNHPVIMRTLQAGAELRIGAGVRMSGLTICAAERVVVGARCVIGANVTIADTDFHSLDAHTRSSPCDAQFAAHAPIEIGDDVFIGGAAVILKGVHIGPGAVIGAGSIVTKDIPSLSIVAGNPAKSIGVVKTGVGPDAM